MIKIAVLDDYQNIFPQIIDIKKYKSKFTFKIFNEPFENEEQAIILLQEFQALFILEERTPITQKIIQSLPNLKFIMTSGTQNKAIDLKTAKSKNITVCGTDINLNSAVEMTWALIFGLTRNMKLEIDNMFQGYWQTTIGYELRGKRLGIIGLGKIGSQVAKVGLAFGMEVSAWSENLNLSEANKLNVLPMSKDDLIKTSDILSIHVVLGDKYKNLITKKEFKEMKKSSFLINTSRGEIINEKDLIEALENDEIAGAGLDVYNQEPLPQDHKLRFLPNAFLLPHLGYVTVENYSKFYFQMIENLNSCINNKPIREIK